MCAAWKKKNERNEIVCFYCTQSDILLCGIARFSRENKNKLRTFQPQKWKKLRTASLKQNLPVLIKRECTRLPSSLRGHSCPQGHLEANHFSNHPHTPLLIHSCPQGHLETNHFSNHPYTPLRVTKGCYCPTGSMEINFDFLLYKKPLNLCF